MILRRYFQEHLAGMIVFAIATGVAGAHLYDELKPKPPHLVRMNAMEQPASAPEVRALIQTMLTTHKLDRACVEGLQHREDAIYVQKADLDGDSVPEYLVAGDRCGFGARTSMFWVYGKAPTAHRLLFDAGALDDLFVSDQRTKGFKDLVARVVTTGGSEFYWFEFRYDGHEYRQDAN